jgi:hypothetical protein
MAGGILIALLPSPPFGRSRGIPAEGS